MASGDGRLDRDVLAALGLPESAWRPVDLSAGAVLFEVGDAADAFYVVVDGALEAYLPDATGRRVVLERLGPDASFGELALLDGGNRTASVAATAASRLAALRRDDFAAALQGVPGLAAGLLRLTGRRLRRNLRHIDHLIAWAELVADGRYDEAQSALAAAGVDAVDDTARFIASFTAMLASVRAREQALARQLAVLRVEIDESRRAASVAEVTETAFFRDLLDTARRLRGAADAPDDPPADGPGDTPDDVPTDTPSDRL